MIELQGVCKAYRNVQAVKDLDLVAPSGEISGLIGPNGAGKSSTIRMIMNIIRPDRGKILVDGKELGPESLGHAGYLPEERGLYRRTEVARLLRYHGALRGCKGPELEKRLDHWLERFDLGEWKHRKVDELSKGMAQKIQFIGSILHDPGTMVFDEPFSGLDPVGSETLIQAIMDLKRQGRTIILSTHMMENAQVLCDRIYMINHGRLVCSGTLEEIQTRHGSNSMLLEFDGDGSFLADLPQVVDGVVHPRLAELVLADPGQSQEVLQAAMSRLRIQRFELVKPSLRRIYLTLAREGGIEREKALAAGGGW